MFVSLFLLLLQFHLSNRIKVNRIEQRTFKITTSTPVRFRFFFSLAPFTSMWTFSDLHIKLNWIWRENIFMAKCMKCFLQSVTSGIEQLRKWEKNPHTHTFTRNTCEMSSRIFFSSSSSSSLELNIIQQNRIHTVIILYISSLSLLHLMYFLCANAFVNFSEWHPKKGVKTGKKTKIEKKG